VRYKIKNSEKLPLFLYERKESFMSSSRPCVHPCLPPLTNFKPTYFHETWYDHNVTKDHSTMAAEQTSGMGTKIAPLNIAFEKDNILSLR